MPCHDDVAAKLTVVRVKPGHRRALARREEFRQQRPAVGIQVLCDHRPVVVTDSVIHHDRADVVSPRRCAHTTPSRASRFFLRRTPHL
jgi:hypothetical protein